MNRASIIMSTFGYNQSLDSALQSISTQTYDNLELILVDDGSPVEDSDRIWHLVKKFQSSKNVIKFHVNKTNIGLTKSLNVAIGISSGDCIFRLDADDLYSPSRIEKAWQDFNLGYSFSGALSSSNFFNSSSLKSTELAKNRLIKLRPVVPHSGFAFTRDLVQSGNGYNELFTYAQDFEFLLRQLNGGKLKNRFKIRNEKLVHLGTVGNSISNSTKRLDQLLFQLLAVLVHHHGMHLPTSYEAFKKEFFSYKAAALVEELVKLEAALRQNDGAFSKLNLLKYKRGFVCLPFRRELKLAVLNYLKKRLVD